VRLVVPNLPTAIDDVLVKAAAKRPAERYQLAGTFADEFARAGGIEPAPGSTMQPEDSVPFATGRRAAVVSDGYDDEIEEPANRPSWLMPVIGGAAGLLAVCLGLVCALQFVLPTVTRALGLVPSPTATTIAAVAVRTPTASTPVTNTVPTAALPAASPVATGTVTLDADREAVRNVVRDSNQVWADAVGKNGNTQKLDTVFGGNWLAVITKQVNDLRANNQYRDAQLTDIRYEEITILTPNTARVKTTERWNDTLRGASGNLIVTNPPVVSQTYSLQRIDGKWLVVESILERKDT
jgi:hypothetical protein